MSGKGIGPFPYVGQYGGLRSTGPARIALRKHVMKFATLTIDGRSFVAAISATMDRFWPIEELTGRACPNMVSLIEGWDALANATLPAGEGRSLEGVRVEAPLIPPRNVLCVGKNYYAHALEFTRSGIDSSAKDQSEAIPTAPIIFTKAPQSIIATGATIPYPAGLSDCVDYEAELAVVIGRGGRGISRSDALDHVFGYTIVNDVTARDLQAKHKQWFIAKSLDGFCPMGPWLVTADEIDVTNLSVRCWVNDDLRQDGNTDDLIFEIPTLIETLSAGITLVPGDVIATGTPAGVGLAFDPPRYLAPGDRVEIEITGLGRLSNTVA
jgi:2-keto-4-pentenoate hydratase/2-oxohepta-3-ene-1,7-dioic acid hydratase in catechol pathway